MSEFEHEHVLDARLASPARNFKPYRGNDVKQGPGQYVKLSNGYWASCTHVKLEATEDGDYEIDDYTVSLLGWGNTYGGLLEDYSEEDQELLRSTLVDSAQAVRGAKGGAANTEAQNKARAENGKKGGRPKRTDAGL
jgi:hypothetical protein